MHGGAIHLHSHTLTHSCRLGGDWVRQCAVGLSGVVFGLIVADNAASRATHRSIFGCAALKTSQQQPTAVAVAEVAAALGALYRAHKPSGTMPLFRVP